MIQHLRSILFFSVLAGVVPTYGATIAYDDPANAGNQAFVGNLALNFTVNSPITVTALGVFNAAGDGIITGPIQVAIFSADTNTQVTPTVTFQGTYTPAGLGFDVFQSISPVGLGPGNYLVEAVGFGPSDLNGNYNIGATGPSLDTGGGLLTFTGAGYSFDTTLDGSVGCPFCQSAPSPQNQQFDAGTFEFVAGSAAPEPASIGLTAFGLGGVFAAWRRKRSQRG